MSRLLAGISSLQAGEDVNRLTPGLLPGNSNLLTMRVLSRYKPAFAAVFLLWPAATLAEKVAGAILPDGVTSVGEGRFRVGKSYEETLKFFKSVYPPARYPRKFIANQPGIKAVHIANPEAKPGGWEGLNVYELKGETRVFVLVAPVEEKARKQSKR